MAHRASPSISSTAGGQVTISGYSAYGFILSHSSYVSYQRRQAMQGFKYGIQIDGAPGATSYGYSENGPCAGYRSGSYGSREYHRRRPWDALRHPPCDSTTWSTSWKMYNISFHDNYVHNTQGEGYYIGNTQYDYQYTCNGTNVDVHPQQIDSVKFYNNIIDHAGWTAAQISQVNRRCRHPR